MAPNTLPIVFSSFLFLMSTLSGLCLSAPETPQSHNWDCGFACTEMVLRALGVPASECSLNKLRNVVGPSSTSIWTVDLAYVLHAFGVRFRFLTATMGVDPAYKHEAFYQPTLETDSVRVNELFDKAASKGVNVENQSVEDDELVALVRPQNQLVMALVDRRYLYRPLSGSVGGVSGLVESCLSYCFSGYVGHYVLIVSYDEKRDGFLIQDPARSAEQILVPARDLHAARRCHGTDEDLVIIPFAQPALKFSASSHGGAGRPSGTPAAGSGSKAVYELRRAL